jgi:hypothetical protein
MGLEHFSNFIVRKNSNIKNNKKRPKLKIYIQIPHLWNLWNRYVFVTTSKFNWIWKWIINSF